MKKKLIILFTILFTFTFSGCESYLDKLDNPNLIINPTLNGLLATATVETGLNVFRMGDAVSYYTQYLAGNTKGSGADIYDEVDYTTTWTDFYGSMMNIKQMNDLAETQSAWYHLGIGKILMALDLNMLMNTFGNVPYSEAFKGKEMLTPGYDTQESIHTTSLQLLDEGIAELQKQNVTVVLDPASDVIHSADVEDWIHTAYGLKARFLNQLSKTSSYNPTAILDAVSKSYDGTNPDDQDAAMTAFVGLSPWNEVAYNNTQLNLDGWLSTQFVDALDGTTYGVVDPRLSKIATITKFGDYRGTTNGAGRVGTGTNQEESYLSETGFYSQKGAPLLIFTYAELKFIEAETAFRADDKTRAYTAYLTGIKAHMSKLGVSTNEQNLYITNPAVSVGEAGLTLDLIFKEKYVVLFLNPEAWVDARRYDYKYKDFGLPAGAVLSTFIRRAGYPAVETSRNGANVPAVSGLDERLFWDK